VPGGVAAGDLDISRRKGLLDAGAVEEAEQGQFIGCDRETLRGFGMLTF
jgi:hypothetical protein